MRNMIYGTGKIAMAAMLGAAAVVAITFMSGQQTVQGVGESEAALNQLSDAFSRVADQASPAVVAIQAEKKISGAGSPFGMGDQITPEEFFRRFFGPSVPNFRGRGRMQQPDQQMMPEDDSEGQPMPYAQGSGFVISADGYIITNNHVVDGADRIMVKFTDNREMTATVVGTDPQTEIALLKVEATGLPVLPLGDSDTLRVGEWVIAIGNPFGLQHSVTAGIVSARGRGNVGIVDYADFIQTDAAINPGNSGGPLLNLKGEVVGLNTAIFTRSGGYMGIGFAIPVNMVKYVQQQLQDNGSVARGFLGVVIQNLTPQLGQWFGTEEGKGVLVSTVSPGSPAEKAGIQRDDIITEYDGQVVQEVGSFRSRVASTPPGKQVDIVLRRGQETLKRSITIGKLDEQAAEVAVGPGGQAKAGKLGISVQNMTPDIASQLGYEGQTGVVVSQVGQNSAAARDGIKPGMLIQEVNRKQVTNVQEFQDAVGASEPGKPILLRVLDEDGYSSYIAVRVE